MWDLDAESALVFERDVATVGIFDGERIAIVDLVATDSVDNKSILVVDVDVIDLVVPPNTCQRLQNDLVGGSVVGEGIVNTFDQELTVFGDRHDRTWETVASGSTYDRIVVDACTATDVGCLEAVLELDSEFGIDTAGELDDRLGLVAVDLLCIVIDGNK